jgi:CRISPR/Cas system-associated exonuclease Cas4 (RecB family)
MGILRNIIDVVMTKNQKLYQDYLLRRLGFEDDVYLKNYLNHLEKNLWIHESNIFYNNDKALDKNWFDYNEVNKIYTPKEINLLSLLSWEYQQKKLKKFEREQLKLGGEISATDLASFKFCPVSFSINKSFKKLKSILLESGTKQHNRYLILKHLKAANKIRDKIKEDEGTIKMDMEFQSVVNSFYVNEHLNPIQKIHAEDIAKSELYFFGHNTNENNNYFINTDFHVSMQPDYILKNIKNEFFVVEEKMKYSNNYVDFRENDKVQIASYLTFLKEYNLSYGYLVYWHFNNVHCHDYSFCEILRIDKTAELESYIYNHHRKLRNFINKKELDIQKLKYNPKKCAKCSVSMICGHKNKKQKKVTIPYNNQFLDLHPAPFPEELKIF